MRFYFRFFSDHFIKRSFGIMFLCLALLSGCQGQPPGLDLTPTPRTLVYSYAIANGMVRGRLMRGAITHQQVLMLAQADRLALMSILVAQKFPSRKNFHLAEEAVVAYLAAIES